MKKFILIFISGVFIVSLLAFVLLLIAKANLSTENINKTIVETAEKNGYKIDFSDSKYKLRLFSLTAELENVVVESNAFILNCRRVTIVLNPILALRKKFELSNLALDSPVLRILKNDSSPEKPKSSADGKLILSTKLNIKNGELIYDSLSAESISGQIFLEIKGDAFFTGKLAFRSKEKYLNGFEKISLLFNGSYNGELDLEKAVVKTSYFSADAKVRENNKIYEYSLYVLSDSTDYLRKLFYQSDSLSMKGTVSFFINGAYDPSVETGSQMETLIDSFEAGFKEFSIEYKEHSAILDDRSFCNKQGNSMVLSTNWVMDSLPLEIIAIADFSRLTRDTLDVRITSKGIHVQKAIDLIRDFKYKIDGRAATISEIAVPLDQIKSIDSIIMKSSHKVTIGEGYAVIDSEVVAFKSFKAEMKSGIVSGFVGLEGMGLVGDLYFTGDYFKKLLNGSSLMKLNLSKFDSSFGGSGEADVKIFYDFKENKFSANAGGFFKNFSHKSINDKLNVVFSDLKMENGGVYLVKKLDFEGNYVEGSFTNLSYEEKNKKVFLGGTAFFDYLNYDSLFPGKDGKKEKESKPPVIDKKYGGEFKVHLRSILFKGEEIKNSDITIKMSEGALYAFPVAADMMKGKVTGEIKYFSYDNGLITAKVRSEGAEINDFLARNKFVPFTIGARVGFSSDLKFLQHKVKESVKGNVSVEAKNGWILMPEVISNVSKVLKIALSDTFYFDDMYGEFEIDSQRVKFEDFVMEKNGHSLLYGGRVDFAKNMNIRGKYVIDMRVADTGLLERILRAAEYPGDSVVVDFEITGNYSKPKVKITHNSVAEYLKEQTSSTINEMLDELNNLFKF
ncbi:MAG: AsmA-like C-terminal region-containing protein [bacterium]|nr:AsmA-like C-terminal region-containing protein [bacterium]